MAASAEADNNDIASTVRQVTIGRVKQYCKIHALDRIVPMIWGPPGVGKSDAIEQLTESYQNSIMIDVRLSLWDPTDVKGIPYFDHTSQTMKWAPPHELPGLKEAEKYYKIILFLDELPSASPSVQAAIYQLILNRQIGEYKLPDNVDVIGAGNRESDKGVTYRMPKPLANRFTHYEIRVSFNEWFDWAISNRIHPEVVGFLQRNKVDLFRFDPKSSDKSFPTPRSWGFVDKTLTRLGEQPDLLDPSALSDEVSIGEMMTDMVSGHIGQGTALKFMAHREITSQLPDPRDIILGKFPSIGTDAVSAHYTLTTNVAYELSDIYHHTPEGYDINSCVDNALKYWMQELSPEMVIMGARILFTKYKMTGIKIRELESWPVFSKNYGHLVHAA